MTEEDGQMISTIMTSLISEILFSKKWQKILEDEVNSLPRYYAQYKYEPNWEELEKSVRMKSFSEIKLHDVRKDVGDYLNVPPVQLVKKTMCYLLQEGLDTIVPRDSLTVRGSDYTLDVTSGSSSFFTDTT